MPRGASGAVTYQVRTADSLLTGTTFQNYALIVSAENDANFTDNSSFVVTTISPGCIPPSIAGQPDSTTVCLGQSKTLSVAANGSSQRNESA